MIRSLEGFENCSSYLKSCGFEAESGLIILYYHFDMFGGSPSIIPNVRQESTLRKSIEPIITQNACFFRANEANQSFMRKESLLKDKMSKFRQGLMQESDNKMHDAAKLRSLC